MSDNTTSTMLPRKTPNAVYDPKALKAGSLIQGGRYTYEIEKCIIANSEGFTYIAITNIPSGNSGAKRQTTKKVVLREHFMTHCSERGADGLTVETGTDIGPTVRGCLESFMAASLDRKLISEQSPNIIDVIDCFEANGTYYYVVEYLDGETLEEYVTRNGGLISFFEARKVLAPVFSAVITMHRHRTLHTDINPRHIMLVKRDNKIEPILFSLYSTLHFDEDGVLVRAIPGSLGRDGYIAPEQYRAFDHFYPQIDIFALAATLVFTLSGKQLPISTKLTRECILQTLPTSLSQSLASAIIHALHPDPHSRTSTVSAFREELSSAIAENKKRSHPNTTTRKISIWHRILNLFLLSRH